MPILHALLFHFIYFLAPIGSLIECRELSPGITQRSLLDSLFPCTMSLKMKKVDISWNHCRRESPWRSATSMRVPELTRSVVSFPSYPFLESNFVLTLYLAGRRSHCGGERIVLVLSNLIVIEWACRFRGAFVLLTRTNQPCTASLFLFSEWSGAKLYQRHGEEQFPNKMDISKEVPSWQNHYKVKPVLSVP